MVQPDLLFTLTVLMSMLVLVHEIFAFARRWRGRRR
jgi:hypothetical protein